MVIQYRSAPSPPAQTPASVPVEPGTETVELPVQSDPGAGVTLSTQGHLQPSVQNQPVRPTFSQAPASFRPVDEAIKGARLSSERAQALEAKLAQEPEDLSARCQLLGYYSSRQHASKTDREARQRHVLWFIQHQPELSVGAYTHLDPLLDGAAYQQAKALWFQQASDNRQNPVILGNAAQFCLLHDRSTAEDLLKQAQALEPDNPAWADRLAQLSSLDAKSPEAGGSNTAATRALDQMEEAQGKTTGEMQRFLNLNKLAQVAMEAGDLQKAKTYATELLKHTTQPRPGWSYGDAVYRGNLVLGCVALRNGQLEEAKQYLLASARTTGSPTLGSFGPNMSLAKELLEQGQRQTVLEFFGLCANFWKADKLAVWADQVTQGWMPDFGANLSY